MYIFTTRLCALCRYVVLYQKFEATHGTIICTTRDKEPLSIFCRYVDMKSIIDQGARERKKDKKNDPSNRCLIGNVNSRDIDFFPWKIN